MLVLTVGNLTATRRAGTVNVHNRSRGDDEWVHELDAPADELGRKS